MPASSEMVGGMVARIHKLPSSSAGKNSLPSRVSRKPTNSEERDADGEHHGVRWPSDQRSSGE